VNSLISVVDDEQDISELICLHLEKNKYQTASFGNGKEFLAWIKDNEPSLVVLDLMLPDLDGIEICKQLKAEKSTQHIPVIMVTAKQDEIDKVIGLEIGADDYVTKPFSPRELVARVKAVLRRSQAAGSMNLPTLNIKDLVFIDPQRFEVVDSNQEKIPLTPTEYNLLLILSENKGWVFSRDQLLEKIWGENKYVIDRTIDVHIKHLRTKLGEAGKYIKNVRGVGYKLDDKD
jgi:DNA-binding response OmpR family regulator